MKKINVGSTTLSDQHPSVAVPITGTDEAEISQQLQLIKAESVDLIEFRIDYLTDFTAAALQNGKQQIQARFPAVPIIATIRTQSEGGKFDDHHDDYLAALKQVINVGFSLLDVEISRPGVADVITIAHQHHQLVIGSFHNFTQTPADQTLLATWQKMETLGCDVAKMAVMPNINDDVLRFMQVSNQANQTLKVPIISMAMGKLGIVTRISGPLTGSVITFGSITNEAQSAPGQITSPQLAAIINIVAPQ
ncbi:type I 3-dehydroquinate dehydratase [Lactobacillus sp. Sy-1]|uniref:type I 3-dehydroquinate dehydratase n=1 Tax=Lactobacillus sp. Sy-1 TaxID=2109645 RepID=UPI001C5B8FD9|nr:type I 3-dehydroquinate dehydratase [Lactobacillus sp. Sy-1]MBW1606304.1 type I 3-dehydroquinate dehydratase [Lactobacillus sp. Sy-1]